LENARAAGDLGNALEAAVILAARGEDAALLRRYLPLLADLFIVSEVSLETAPDGGPVSARVERARGEKCQRCWHVTRDVGSEPSLPGVCARCARAVRLILEARGGKP